MSLASRIPAASVLLVMLGTCASVPAETTPAPPGAGAVAPAVATSAQQAPRFGLQGAAVQGGVMVGTVPYGTTLLALDGVSLPFAPDGRFLIAFDRDAKASAQLTATLGDGSQVRQELAVAPRAWDISRLSTLPKYPVPQPEFQRVRPSELAQINGARAMQTEARGWSQPFLWPVTGRISTLFGSQRIYANGEAGSYHSGVDVARPTGTPVLAPADGVVILAAAKPFTLEGHLLMVDHGMGLNSAFMHLSRIDVRLGEHVRRGQTIGAVGSSGRATGPHLHWGMKWRDARIDPLLLAGPMPAAD